MKNDQYGQMIFDEQDLVNQIMQGNQKIPSDTSFSLNRTDAFPYVFLSRKLFKIAARVLGPVTTIL